MASELAWVNPDAVIRLGSEMDRYTRFVPEVRSAVTSGADAVHEEILAELYRRELDLQRAEDDYRRCRLSEDDRDCSYEEHHVRSVRESVERARAALSAYRSARTALNEASSRYRSNVDIANLEIQRRLAEIARELGIYQRFALSIAEGGGGTVSFAGGGGSSGVSAARSGGSGASGGSSTGSSATGASTPAGVPEGYTMVPVAMIDDAGSRVQGDADFKMDCSPGDLEWGFTALQEVVLPALARGKGIDYFRERDQRENRMGNRSYADTYTGFFSPAESPRFQATGSGRFTVANGYHRLWVAKNLGVAFIPGQVVE